MANEEQKLNVKRQDGYSNIYLKDIEPDNYIIVEKVFPEGLEKEGKYGKYYIVKAKYNDEEVSFFLSSREHDTWKNLGGEGDLIKVTAFEETIKVKSNKMIVTRRKFDLV